jgi:hypothetical protein
VIFDQVKERPLNEKALVTCIQELCLFVFKVAQLRINTINRKNRILNGE